ncbi:nitroreductase family protein [Brevibacillus laterosporus]|uniref:nitroreductase family protein n=1 Tax=Brevibacillus laterosporus TaxID=1465 RepID=UPI000BCAA74F|nr:nitroreductase family protein [Brevibacillus laterosporus]PCN43496.1 nitroreductase family protein [Brevibacillus laterosporus]
MKDSEKSTWGQLHRKSQHAIDPIYLNRWSPRSFAEKPVEPEKLYRIFEAARWAPSGSNEQPWRYILARSPEDRATFLEFIMSGNTVWCDKAPVLALLLSRKLSSRNEPLRSHSFDAGTSWGYLALECVRQGLVTHAMGGFYPDKARELLKIPDEYEIEVVIAIGYQGEKEALSEAFQEREMPNSRRELDETIFEGRFGDPFS